MNDQEHQAVLDQIEAEPIKIRGFFRVHIKNEDGSLAGDSGWQENQVTDLGFNKFLIFNLIGSAGALSVSHVGLGTGTVPGAAATTLDGEVGTRQGVTASTSTTSKMAQFLATFAAGWHSSAAAHNIANIGLFNSSSAGTLFAGKTYASSSCASNQAVNITYQVTFA